MHVLASLLAAPVILAQAGPTGQVDYEILRGELRESLAPYFKALFSSARGEKSSLPAFDVEAARKPFRERAQQATGELRQALRIAEVTVVVSCKAPDYRSAVLALIQEVPPESRAWSFVPGLLQVMAGLREAPVVAFMDSFMEKGVPDVRQILLADRVRMTAHKGTPEQHRLAVAALQKAFPDSLEAKRAVEALTQTQATRTGVKAPDFQVEDLDRPGEMLTLGGFKGKYLLLDFWGTWCTFCVKELPATHKIYAAWKSRGLEILSLASDATPELVRRFRRQPGQAMPWRHAFIGRQPVHPVAVAYGVQSFPSLFLIAPDGRILAQGNELREANLEATLVKYLK